MTIYTQAKHDFNDGTTGPFLRVSNGGNAGNITVVADPTGSGRGKVVNLQYPGIASSSTDVAVSYGHAVQGYGKTISATMDVYCASGTGTYNIADNRKILDFIGVSFSRATLHRVGAGGNLRVSIIEHPDGAGRTDNDPDTGYTLADNTWATFRAVITTNSASGVYDGTYTLDMNGTLIHSRTNVPWIDTGAADFNSVLFGKQLTLGAITPYTDTRYVDNCQIAFGADLINLSGPTVYVKDTFTRTANATSLGSTDTGQAYTVTGTPGVAGIDVSTTTGSQGYWPTVGNPGMALVTAPSADGILKWTNTTTAGAISTGWNFRATDLSNRWSIGAYSGHLYLTKIVAGASTPYDSGPISAGQANDTTMVVLNGSSISVYLNNNPVSFAGFSGTDSFNSAVKGFGPDANNDPACRFGLFYLTANDETAGAVDTVTASVTVTPSTATVAIAATTTLTSVSKNAAGTTLTGKTPFWSSLSPSVATVNSSTGVVTGVSAGTVVITSTEGGFSGTSTVTVTALTIAPSRLRRRRLRFPL